MTDILDLKGWTVLGRAEEDGADVLEAEYPQPMPTACPKCGTVDCVYRHGTKATTYVDIPMRGRPAKLRAKVQRYRCTSCKETFLQPLGGILEGRRMTERCANRCQSCGCELGRSKDKKTERRRSGSRQHPPAAAHLRALQRRFPHGGTQSQEASLNRKFRIAQI